MIYELVRKQTQHGEHRGEWGRVLVLSIKVAIVAIACKHGAIPDTIKSGGHEKYAIGYF